MPDDQWSPDQRTLLSARVDFLVEKVTDMGRRMEGQLNKIEQAQVQDYVTRDEFKPVRLIVYGMVGIILAAVLTAIIALVIGGKKF